jgi:hypothetical protein
MTVGVLGCDWSVRDVIADLRKAGVKVLGVDANEAVHSNVDVALHYDIGLGSSLGEAAQSETKRVEGVAREIQRQEATSLVVDKEIGLPLAFEVFPAKYQVFVKNNLGRKDSQHAFLAQHGVPLPRVFSLEIGQHDSATSHNTAWVSKPILGSGSASVHLVDPATLSEEQIKRQFVQEYHEGDPVYVPIQFTRQAYQVLGAVLSTNSLSGTRSGYRGYKVELNHGENRTIDCIAAAIEGFEGSIVVELLRTPTTTLVLEVTPIDPPLLLRSVLGLQIAVGDDGKHTFEPADELSRSQYSSGYWVFSQDFDLQRNEAVESAVGVLPDGCKFLAADAGSPILDADGNPRPVGFVVIKHANATECHSLLDAFLQRVRIRTTNDRNVCLRVF